jgi:hypothetical protein
MLRTLLLALPALLLMSALVYLEWDHSARAKPSKAKARRVGLSAARHATRRSR